MSLIEFFHYLSLKYIEQFKNYCISTNSNRDTRIYFHMCKNKLHVEENGGREYSRMSRAHHAQKLLLIKI